MEYQGSKGYTPSSREPPQPQTPNTGVVKSIAVDVLRGGGGGVRSVKDKPIKPYMNPIEPYVNPDRSINN